MQDKMQEYKGQGIVLQGDTNNNNLFKVCVGRLLVSDVPRCLRSCLKWLVARGFKPPSKPTLVNALAVIRYELS